MECRLSGYAPLTPTDTMELQLAGYAPPIAQTQWNFDSLVMRHQPHRYNGITIIWLCTTNRRDTMEFQPSGYAPLTMQIQWNYNYLVMHN